MRPGGNAFGVAAEIAKLGPTARQAVHRATVLWTAQLQRKVQQNASGRPGPNAPTGNYRRSINRQTTARAATSEGLVGTNAPQGRRLELGFSGTDSRGRNYDQPAFAHFGPALDEIGPEYEKAIGDAGVPGRGRFGGIR